MRQQFWNKRNLEICLYALEGNTLEHTAKEFNISITRTTVIVNGIINLACNRLNGNYISLRYARSDLKIQDIIRKELG